MAPQGTTATTAAKVTLSGTGNKTGPAVVLAGDYTISAKVIAKPGCSWTLSINPGNDDVVSVSTDAAGSQELILPISLAAGSYRIVVTSTKCANWAVSLTH